MLFHISYEFSPEDRQVVQERFKETGGVPPEGVKMIGRWHSLEGGKGFVVAESDDAINLGKWIQDWSDFLIFTISPVVGDEEQMEVIA